MPFKINPEINAEMSALQRRLDAYTASHVQGVRDLAEMVSICTSAHRERLDDQEDPLGIVFRDAVGLYREKHNITETALHAALVDWRAVEVGVVKELEVELARLDKLEVGLAGTTPQWLTGGAVQ